MADADEIAHARRLSAELASWREATGHAPAPRRRGSPLDLLTDFRIGLQAQVCARLRICRAIIGAAPSGPIGPKYRRATNHPLFEPWSIDWFMRPHSPCPSCSADGGELGHVSAGNSAYWFCPSCKGAWLIGDYDWDDAASCRRFVTDRAADLIYRPEEERCGTCGDLQVDRCSSGGMVVCPHPDCPFAYLKEEQLLTDEVASG